jgi:replicative DNA helicase
MDKRANLLKAVAGNKELVAAIAKATGMSTDVVRVELEVTGQTMEEYSSDAKLRKKLEYQLNQGQSMEQIHTTISSALRGLNTEDVARKIAGYPAMLEAIEAECNREAAQTGLNLGPWRNMQRRMNGFHTGGYLYVVGGRAGSGKSTFMRNLGVNLVRHNRAKVFVLYISLDDSNHDMVPHLLSQMCGVAEEKVVNTAQALPREKVLIKNAWTQLKELNEEFQIVDGNMLSSLSDIKAIARLQREKHPSQDLIICVDSFHDIQTPGMRSEERLRLGDVAKELKDLAVELNSTIIAGAHLNKLKERLKDGRMCVARPKREDLSETGTLDYEANTVFLCHNELDAQGDLFAEYREVVNLHDNVEFKPIIEICPAKNKIVHRFKQTTFFKFDGDSSALAEVEDVSIHEGAPKRQKEVSRPTPPKGSK